MQKDIPISDWMSISKIFLSVRKNFGIGILLIFTFGLFSNPTSAQSGLSLETFNSGTIPPSGWNINSTPTVTSNWGATSATGGHSSTRGMTVDPGTGSPAQYFLITPQFNTPAVTEIRFYTKLGSPFDEGGTYKLMLSTASQPSINNFVEVKSWTEANLNIKPETYEEKIVTIDLPAGVPVYLAFVAISDPDGSGSAWFVDDVRVIESCPKVTGIQSTMTSSGGIITWTHPSATNFEIQVVPKDSGVLASGTTVTGSVNGPFSYTASGLKDGTDYDVYIKTNCDATTGSLWAGPFLIKTLRLGLGCATPSIIPDISVSPYVLSANLNTFYDNTTYVPLDSKPLSCQPFGSDQNWLSGEHAFLSYTPTVSGLVNVSMLLDTSGGVNNCWNSMSSIFIFDACPGTGTPANCFASLVTGSNGNGNSAKLPNVYLEAKDTNGNPKTYYFVISSPFQHSDTAEQSAGICFTFTLSQPSCSIPSGLSIDQLTQTSAAFSWANPQNLVSKWEFVVKPTASGIPNGTDVAKPTSTNSNVSITNLTAATSYSLYVRSVCGAAPGTPEAWSAPLNFKTPCNITALPYNTGFDTSDTTVGCWSQLNLNNDADFFNLSAGTPLGSQTAASVRTGNAGNATNDMLISPQFHLDGVKQKRLRFKYNIYGNWGLIVDNPKGGPGSFEVKISTTGIGAQNFTTTVIPLASYTTAYNFIELIVPLPDITGDINIAWILPNGATQTETSFWLDDVYVEDLPDCSEPTYPGVTAGSITPNSAEFYWTNGYKNTQWEIAVQPLNSGVPTGNGVVVGTNPYTMNGLTSSTRYEYYVRAYCSATSQSAWVGPVAFNTLCEPQPIPYHESFDDADVKTKKFCWSINNKNADKQSAWTIEATQASINYYDLFMNPFVSYDDYLISANVDTQSGAKILKFKYKVASTLFNPGQRGNLEVLMSSTPNFDNATVLIPSHDFSNGDYLEDSVIFEGKGPSYFALHVPPTMSDPRNTGIVKIDDFSIEDAPTCSNPSLLTASNILTNSATLSWKLGFTETKWEVAIQSLGSGVPTASGAPVDTNPTYNATGLAENTTYEYYVKAVCGSALSEWVGPFQFKTICSALPTPFLETFDSNSATQSCWTIANNNKDSNSWSLNMSVKPIFGDEMAALFTGNNGNNDDYLITPTLKVHPGQRLRFFYKVLYSDFEEDLKVMLSTNGVATDQFSAILYENNFTTTTDATGTVAGSNTITVGDGQKVRVGDTFVNDIATWYTGYPIPYGTTVTGVNGSVITLSAPADLTLAGPQHISFVHETINNEVAKEMVLNLSGITTETTINLAFHTPYFPPNPWNYRGQYTFIDNVIVEDIPACPSVYNVTTNDKSTTDTTAIIDWQTAGSETSWQISVQPFGTPAPVGNTLPQYLKTAAAHPYTITGLTPSTKYQYYIRSVCSGTSQNEWVGPFDFLTKCDLSNVCKYTISLTNGKTGQVYPGLELVQNGVVQQLLTFPIDMPNQPATTVDYEVFLCSGIEFSLYWRNMGVSGLQYYEAQAVIKDQSGNVVWTSPLGLGTVNTNIFTGVSSCKTITCPQPTNLAANNMGVLSWTPGGTETQWEVFVQPLEQGSIPQKGITVTSPSYKPVASDFALSPTAGTNEFFVRAVCSESDKSYWTGPKVFIKNDEPETAIALQVNTDGACTNQGTKASFIGATVSTTPTACTGVNGGDIWYEFVATSRVHTVELSNFNPGSYYASSFQGSFPSIVLSLYEVQDDGSLVEKACSENNSLVTTYTSECTVGKTYKIRAKYNATEINDKKFDICVSTPADICNMDAFNYSFEKLPMQDVTGVSTIILSKVIPGWRTNTDAGEMFFAEQTNGSDPYEGAQCIQLIQDPADTWDPAGPIKGLYKDFDTPSEILKVKYSFASATRQVSVSTTVELWAGPPAGPFTMIDSHTATSAVWTLIKGTYVAPAGQTTTRFIFRVRDNAIGHLLDAANFKASTDIITEDQTIPCHITSVTTSAEGTGEWVADTNNPAQTIIETPASQTTNISGFNTPGVYTYFWKTRYCEKPFKVTYQGFYDVATVTTPVKYCLSDAPIALTATAPAGFTLLWYTVPVGGTGDVNAPTPTAAAVGTTTYYVALVNADGCVGPRKAIDVIVSDYANPVVGFTYDKDEYCVDAVAPVITMDKDFTTGGNFTATPAGLSIDGTTGDIDLKLSTPGNAYTVTYSVAQQDCHFAGTHSVIVKVDNACGFIPKGISPNDDGNNDQLDLAQMHIQKINIFNRYGTEVYSHGEGYTNQWLGQSNSGHALPDGTYFYIIVKGDGNKVTGWIFINRQH